MGLPAIHHDDGTRKTYPLPKRKNIDPKDSGRNIQLVDKGQPKALETVISGAGTKYQVYQTQSTRFEVLDPDHNKGKTSLEVEPDTDTLILAIVADIQSLLRDSEDELKDDSDEEVFEAGEKMDEDIQEPDNEGIQPPHSIKRPSTEGKEQPTKNPSSKSSKEPSLEPSLEAQKKPNKYKKRREKHEEAANSYADLKAAVEGFAAVADNNRNNYDIAINSVMETVELGMGTGQVGINLEEYSVLMAFSFLSRSSGLCGITGSNEDSCLQYPRCIVLILPHDIAIPGQDSMFYQFLAGSLGIENTYSNYGLLYLRFENYHRGSILEIALIHKTFAQSNQDV
ncbi:hypothetical protein Tco_0325136 [Tanacetum coccineum]